MEILHKKNTAYYLALPAVDSATPASFKSGVSPVDTAYYKDAAGAWTTLAITDTAAEIGSTGVYEIDLTAAELNHDMVFIKFAVSGMADTFVLFRMKAKDIDTTLAANPASGGIVAASFGAGAIDTAALATDAITAAKIAAGAIGVSEAPNLDAAVSTRSSHAAADVWSVVTRALTDKAGFTISGTTQTFDALDTLLDAAHGAGSWATAVGFSTHAAADIWSVVTRALTDKAGFTVSGTLTTLDALNTDLDSSHGVGSWTTAAGFSTHAAADIWSVVTRALTDKAGFTLSGVTQTFDAFDTLLDGAHGAGSWATAVGFSTHDANAVRDAILSDSTPFAGANINATISSRSDFDEATDPVELLNTGGTAGTSAEELVDDIFAETMAELTAGVPATTPSLAQAIMLLYMPISNRMDANTSGTPDYKMIYNAAGSVIAKKAITDDGSDYSEAKAITGP